MIQQKHLYYLNANLKSGKPAWYIIKAFDNIKLALLQKLIADNKPYNIRDYAEILYGGYEAVAPQQVLDEVNSKFGTNFTNK